MALQLEIPPKERRPGNKVLTAMRVAGGDAPFAAADDARGVGPKLSFMTDKKHR